MQMSTGREDLNLVFQELYANHASMVRNVVRLFNFRDAAADDLVQDIFFLAWNNFTRLKDRGALPGWLHAIARNQCINAIRSQKVQQKYLVPMDELSLEAETQESRKFFEVSLMQFEQHMQVLEDLIHNHEDPTRRAVATLFYLEHLSVKDIAERLQMKSNTVLSHLRRFRLIVTKAMQQWMEENVRD
jgi:RNA polymerase sigma-70 factor (ECF subfamily)